MISPAPSRAELQPGAVIVLGIGVAGLAPRGDRPLAVAELVADTTQREPGRGEIGRELDRLAENIGGPHEVAASRVIERPLVAPVGDQIAG